jgi:hypothetical protein
MVYYFIDNIEKPFSTHKVRRFEDQPWIVKSTFFDCYIFLILLI